jgi:hypothetical protein
MNSNDWTRLERIAKLMKRVTITDGGCWLFPAKYRGQARDRDGRVKYVYRFMYELWNNVTLEKGVCIRHLCNSSGKCINPAHLTTGTHEQNMHDKLFPPVMEMIKCLEELGYVVSHDKH